MTLEELLEEIDDSLDKGWVFPLSGGRSVVDVEEIREIVQEMRLNMPQEIRRAKIIESERDEIIAAAKRESGNIIRAAEERAKLMVAQEEIVKMAQQKSGELVTAAQQKSRELVTHAQQKSKDIKTATYEYADKILSEMDKTIAASLHEVRSARQNMKNI
jgi:vacuolar-type H+-ATPase subunit H